MAALIAFRLCNLSKDYMFASHLSQEPACTDILNQMSLKAIIDGNMRLGEGTGAVMAMSLFNIIDHVYKNMTSFEEFDMEPYKPL